MLLEKVRNYAEGFMDLPENLFAVCDTVRWTRSTFMEHLENELGMNEVVFADMNTTGDMLANDILGICKQPHNITVDSENFLRMFKINDNNMKILRSTRKEVANFETMKQNFYAQKENFNEQEKIDLVFEFQAWMSQEIIEAQKRVSGTNSFTFKGKKMANEAGHIASLTNQLKAILIDIRTTTLEYQNDHGLSTLRRCPHCGLVWAKIE